MDPEGMLSSPYVPCTIVMPHFSKHKSDDDQWFSCPFYSAPGGYRLCFRVTAGGRGAGAGTHVSLHVFLMKGENDCQLQWPFEHTLTFQILNWKNDANHEMGIIPFKTAPEGDKARVTSGEGLIQDVAVAKFSPTLCCSMTKTKTLHIFTKIVCACKS